MAGRRDEAWRDLRASASDRRSGAAEILRRAGASIAALPRADLEEAVRTLVRAHPSMAPLWRLGSEVLRAGDHVAAAAAFVREAERDDRAAATAARELVSDEVVLHSWSSTVALALEGTAARAWCARSEPGGEGVTMARRLVGSGVTATVVSDEEALSRAGSGATVVVGADAVGPAGVVNKVRTKALAEATTGAGGQALAVAGRSKLLSADLPSPPPFERTALTAFTAVVAGDGPLLPDDAIRLAGRFHVHRVLEEELAALR